MFFVTMIGGMVVMPLLVGALISWWLTPIAFVLGAANLWEKNCGINA
jgi:hypothetical protein